MKRVIPFFILSGLFVACGSTEFTGDQPQAAPELGKSAPDSADATAATPTPTPKTEEVAAVTTPDPSSVEGVDQSTLGQGLSQQGNVGSGALPNSGSITPVTPNPNGSGGSSVPPGSLSLITEFGDSTVFRIGDGNASGSISSCMNSISTSPLRGKKYTFGFDVLEDDTNMQIILQNICGVDIADFNYAAISGPDGTTYREILKVHQSRLEFDVVKLKKGHYSLIVESTRITAGQYIGHFDDFMVGDIAITSDKTITPGAVLAQ